MIVLAVLLVGVITAVALASVEASADGPLDVPDHWLLRHTPRPLRGVVARLDRRVRGGATIAVGLLVVFAVGLVLAALLELIDDGPVQDLDDAVAEWAIRNATDGSTAVLEFFTDFGGTEYLLALMAVVGAVVGYRRRSWGPIAYLATVGFGISLLNNGLKWIIERDRPAVLVDPLSNYAGSSFPSGHTAAAAACWAGIAVVLAVGASRRVRWMLAVAAVFIAVTVAATRVLLVVHWLSDVVAGLFVGWMWAFVATLAFGGRWLELGRSSVPPEPAESRHDDEAPLDERTIDAAVTERASQ